MRPLLLTAAGVALLAALSVVQSASFSICTAVTAPVAEVKRLIIDLPRLTRLHPLTVACRPIPPDPRFYEVKDRVSVLGLWETHLTIEAVISTVDEHTIVVEAHAPLRVNTRSQWRITEREDGLTEVSEEFTIWAPLALLHFSKATAYEAHVNLLAAMRKELERGK